MLRMSPRKLAWLCLNPAGLHLRVRVALHRLVELRVVRLRRAAVDVEEHVLILGRGVELVERRVRDHERPVERRAARGRVEDARDREVGRSPLGTRIGTFEPTWRRVLLRVVLVGERLRGPSVSRTDCEPSSQSSEKTCSRPGRRPKAWSSPKMRMSPTRTPTTSARPARSSAPGRRAAGSGRSCSPP